MLGHLKNGHHSNIVNFITNKKTSFETQNFQGQPDKTTTKTTKTTTKTEVEDHRLQMSDENLGFQSQAV